MNRLVIGAGILVLTAAGGFLSMLVLRPKEPSVVAPVSIRPVAPKKVEPEPEPQLEVPPPADPAALAALEEKLRASADAERILDEEHSNRALAKKLRDGMVTGGGAGNGVRITRAFEAEAVEQMGYRKHRDAELGADERRLEELRRKEELEKVGARCQGKWKPAAKARVKAGLKKKEAVLPKGADKEQLLADAQDLASLVDAAKTLEECGNAQALVDRWEGPR